MDVRLVAEMSAKSSATGAARRGAGATALSADPEAPAASDRDITTPGSRECNEDMTNPVSHGMPTRTERARTWHAQLTPGASRTNST
ncbi:hypothetical protein GCM10010201_07070 [Pilimelia columellifera subsp. columellifera]|uniref:Uncharacterized protein n=1 Tax=Pilimelia columellifera subsp. columellifera TaxID=706583 RepID=A0ABP6AEB1_9ACTN